MSVNWEEAFKDYKKSTFTDISSYVDEVKPEYQETLVKQIEDGISFLSIKRDFYKAYFKKYLPVAKPKNAMKEWANKQKKE